MHHQSHRDEVRNPLIRGSLERTRATSEGPRAPAKPTNIDVNVEEGRVPRHEEPFQNSPHQLAPSVGTYHSPLQASYQASDSTKSHERRRRPNLGKHKEWWHHDRRHPSHQYGYDLTTSNSSPERSPRRENRQRHKGVVTSQSLKQQSYKDKKKERDRCNSWRGPEEERSTKRDAGGKMLAYKSESMN
ncbi:hypothetical protein LIER_25798 [Lithospermum erythrorhizon]|uniref:Uncharacterized protein n=1 Tax=Lithospermum erythrorhizon TaxID=34254 RepID=A0AAV3R634_LITER